MNSAYNSKLYIKGTFSVSIACPLYTCLAYIKVYMNMQSVPITLQIGNTDVYSIQFVVVRFVSGMLQVEKIG